MKIITIPESKVDYETLQTINGITRKVKVQKNFGEFVIEAVNSFDLFGKGLDNIEKGLKIKQLAREANGTLTLEDDHYKKLWDAVDKGTWAPEFAEHAIDYFRAVKNAEDVQKK